MRKTSGLRYSADVLIQMCSVIVMDTLCGNSEGIGPPTQPISSSYTNNIFAMVSYGEESWRTGQSYDAQNSATCPNDAVSYGSAYLPGSC